MSCTVRRRLIKDSLLGGDISFVFVDFESHPFRIELYSEKECNSRDAEQQNNLASDQSSATDFREELATSTNYKGRSRVMSSTRRSARDAKEEGINFNVKSWDFFFPSMLVFSPCIRLRFSSPPRSLPAASLLLLTVPQVSLFVPTLVFSKNGRQRANQHSRTRGDRSRGFR